MKRFLRAALLGLVALSSFASTLVDASPIPHGAGGQIFATPGSLVTFNIASTSGSTIVAPTSRFAHEFKDGDVPSGTVPQWSVAASGDIVPCTVARRNLFPSGALRMADFIGCQNPDTVPATGLQPWHVAAISGSYAPLDTLPASKTTANIVTDLTTNIDNETVTLNNVTNSAGTNLGTLTADMRAAFALGACTSTCAGGGYFVLAQGNTAEDFLAFKKFGSSPLYAYWWVTANLNASTGAVTFLEKRTWVVKGRVETDNDDHTYTVSMSLGSGVARTFGASTDEGGSRAITIALGSAVDTSADTIVMPANGFHRSDAFTLTCTGASCALPGGLSTSTLYYVNYIDTTHIGFCGNEDCGYGDGIYIDLTSQGSGTLVFHPVIEQFFAAQVCLCRLDGLWDRMQGTGQTSYATLPAVSYTHDPTYYLASGIGPFVDPAAAPINPSTISPVTQAMATLSPGTLGPLKWNLDDFGGGSQIGPWTMYAAWAHLAESDWNGYVKQARALALMQGSFPIYWTITNTGRLPAVNNGHNYSGTAYAGIGLTSGGRCFDRCQSGGDVLAPFVSQSGFAGACCGSTGIEPSHWPHGIQEVYQREGGADLLDMMMKEANFGPISLLPIGTCSNVGDCRQQPLSIGGFVAQFMRTTQTRADAWMGFSMMYAATSCTNDTNVSSTFNPTAECTYETDFLNDTVKWIVDFETNQGSSSYRASGLWKVSGGDHNSGVKPFMEDFFDLWVANMWTAHPTADSHAMANAFLPWIQNQTSANYAPYKSSYMTGVKLASGTYPQNNDTDYFTGNGFGAYDSYSKADFQSDGQTVIIAGTPFTPVANGDQFWFTDTDYGNNGAPGSAPFPGAGISVDTKYFICGRSITGPSGSTPAFYTVTARIGTDAGCTSLLSGITPTTGVTWLYGGPAAASAPISTFFDHNAGVSWSNQNYHVLALAVANAWKKIGLLSATNATRLQTLVNAESQSDTPSQFPQFFFANH